MPPKKRARSAGVAAQPKTAPRRSPRLRGSVATVPVTPAGRMVQEPEGFRPVPKTPPVTPQEPPLRFMQPTAKHVVKATAQLMVPRPKGRSDCHIPPEVWRDHRRHPRPGPLPMVTLLPQQEEGCKCFRMLLVPTPEILQDMPEEKREAAARGEWQMANRCRYFLRPAGCRKGDACEYCHVHPVDRTTPQSAYERWSEARQAWVKMNKGERKRKRDELERSDPSRLERLSEKSLLLHRIRDDFANNVCLGEKWEGFNFAFWTVPRLAEQALKCRRRLADIFHSMNGNLPEHHIGIWYGVDKQSQNPGHYRADSGTHGVHTLMRGLASRLEGLAEQCTGTHIILMEGDATPVATFPLKILQLSERLKQEAFCWLGFFTSERPNHTKAQDTGKGAERGPLFHSDCTKEHVHPDYGCQMFMVAKDFIPGMCKRMRESPYPHGFDRWIFSPNFCYDYQCAFTDHSLAGQLWGPSDSWGHGNSLVGEMRVPPEDYDIKIRRFSDTDFLRQKRLKLWTVHKNRDKVSRKRGVFGTVDQLANWQESSASAPPGRMVVRRPASAAALAKATPKVMPEAHRPDTESSDEETRDRRNATKFARCWWYDMVVE